MSWTWIDGRVVPSDQARVAAGDLGLLTGFGVYETLVVRDTTPLAWRRHLARLRRSAATGGLVVPLDDDHLRQAADATVTAQRAQAPDGDLRLRITVTAGVAPGPSRPAHPTVIVTASPQAPWAAHSRLITSRWPLDEHSPLTSVKTVSRHAESVALAEARAAGADEAVRYNTAGFLCEGSASNVFLEVDGALVTPGLATGCLPGTIRDLVIETSAVTERLDLTADDLAGAREAFVTSATRHVHPVASIDRRRLPACPGPLTEAADRALEALLAADPDPAPRDEA